MKHQPTTEAYQQLKPLEDDAIQLLKLLAPTDAYYGCFSGGKDSTVMKHLAQRATVPVEWHYHVTGLEPFETHWFVKNHHPDVIRDKPNQSFWSLAKNIGFPTRRYRWCCRHLKENHCPKRGRLLLGVRADESPRRAKTWQHVAWHEHERLWAICPLYNWTADHIWAYIDAHSLPYCSLYDEGFDRIGCIGCPLASAKVRRQQFDRWPNIAEKWRDLMRGLWATRKQQVADAKTLWAPETQWTSWQDMFNWYVDNDAGGSEPCGAGEHMLSD